MNKVLLFSIALLCSAQSFSENLDCAKYANTFKNQAYQSYALAKTTSYEEYKKFGQETDYSYLFVAKHPDQLYRSGAWYSEEEALDMSKAVYNLQRLGLIKDFKMQVLAAKGSYQSQYGDVCVMPIKAQYRFLDQDFENDYDAIMVRHPKTKRWRVFTYLGIEKKKDMAEFFPDFPANIKLAAARYNGKNYAEIADENARYYHEFYGLTMTEEYKTKLADIKRENMKALKENGFLE